MNSAQSHRVPIRLPSLSNVFQGNHPGMTESGTEACSCVIEEKRKNLIIGLSTIEKGRHDTDGVFCDQKSRLPRGTVAVWKLANVYGYSRLTRVIVDNASTLESEIPNREEFEELCGVYS